MIAKDILAHLPPRLLSSLEVFSALPSTNTALRQRAEAGAAHATVLIAEEQTAGRGRLDRQFASPRGAGLYISLLLRQALPHELLPLLTPYAAVVTAEALEEVAAIEMGIKWVNDLFCGGKKLAGILTEGGFAPNGELSYAVVGIGINLRSGALPPALSEIAAAVEDFTAPPERERLAAALIRRFYEGLPSLVDRSFLPEYRRRSLVLGQTVTARDGHRLWQGTALAIEDDAALRILSGGEEILLRAGEVSIKM